MSERVLFEILNQQSIFDGHVLKFMNTQAELNLKLAKRISKQRGLNLILFGGLLIVGSELMKMKREMDQLKESKCGKGVSDEC